MKGRGRFAAVAAALFLCTSAAARAEELETTAALSVNALNGDHEVSRGDRSRLSFAPLPLAEVTFRYRTQTLRFEGLPPLGVGYGGLDGTTLTSLSILNATYRLALRSGWFAGAGETVYNQRTTYASHPGDYYDRGTAFLPINGGPESQYSRVTGLRLEAGREISAGANHIEFDAAFNPRMHGTMYTRVPSSFTSCSFVRPNGPAVCTQDLVVSTFADDETAAQIDLMARVAHRISRHGELLLGLRYLNYSANYNQIPGQIADRNVGFAPSLGYRVRL